MTATLKAEKQFVHPHHRATSKPRQEGFQDKDEEIMNLKISSAEYIPGDSTVHEDSKTRVSKMETHSGVGALK
jgi:hypothetical protein